MCIHTCDNDTMICMCMTVWPCVPVNGKYWMYTMCMWVWHIYIYIYNDCLYESGMYGYRYCMSRRKSINIIM